MPDHIHNYSPAREVQLNFPIQKMSYLINEVSTDLSSMYSIKSVLSSGQKDKLLKDCLQKCQVLYILSSTVHLHCSYSKPLLVANVTLLPMFAPAQLNQIPSSLGPEYSYFTYLSSHPRAQNLSISPVFRFMSYQGAACSRKLQVQQYAPERIESFIRGETRQKYDFLSQTHDIHEKLSQ